MQPCALRSPSGSRERKKETKEFLKQKTESIDEIELLAEVDGAVVGSARIGCVARREKTRHRARFGISVDKAYWGLGIGPVRRVSQRAPFRRVTEKDFMGGRKT